MSHSQLLHLGVHRLWLPTPFSPRRDGHGGNKWVVLYRWTGHADHQTEWYIANSIHTTFLMDMNLCWCWGVHYRNQRFSPILDCSIIVHTHHSPNKFHGLQTTVKNWWISLVSKMNTSASAQVHVHCKSCMNWVCNVSFCLIISMACGPVQYNPFVNPMANSSWRKWGWQGRKWHFAGANTLTCT